MMYEYFRTMARHNRWANGRLYAAAASLDDADYRADRGAFFGSLHITLNHILWADRTWMARIVGEEVPGGTFDTIQADDLAALREAREAEDARIAAHVDSLDDGALARPLRYANTRGEQFAQPLGQVLGHLFNHQTHHRGQAHAILTGLGRDAPEMDLIYYLREVG